VRINVKLVGAVLTAALGFGAMAPSMATFALVNEEAAAEETSQDNGWVYEEPEVQEEAMGPLTPDGNMNLVDDYGNNTGAGKQFITVTSKDGNFFYIIIDRDDHGEETVHFLNLVDEEDLMALVDDNTVSELQAKKEAEEAARKAAEEAIREQKEKDEANQQEEEPKEEKKSSAAGIVVPLILFAGIGGGIFWLYLQKQKDTGQSKRPDPDGDYYDDEDEENIEVPEEDGFEYLDEDDSPDSSQEER